MYCIPNDRAYLLSEQFLYVELIFLDSPTQISTIAFCPVCISLSLLLFTNHTIKYTVAVLRFLSTLLKSVAYHTFKLNNFKFQCCE